MDGTVSVDSVVGRGSTFRVRLPARLDAAAFTDEWQRATG
jgi:signal transduction histidine kinase